MADPTDATDEGKPSGAILSDQQIRKVRLAVIGMSIALLAGVATLIGRVVYLANRGGEQATVFRGGETLAPNARLVLPAGASVKSTSLAGNRLAAHYTGPKGEGLLIFDLVTGTTLSHVRFETSP